MRLIDADELRHDMYDAAFIQDSDMQKWDGGCWIRYKMFEKMLEKQDEAIVRCKDCKYRRNSNLGWYCGYEYDRSDPYEMTRRADDENYYCADAERREENKC